jgi:hypothetical protein
VFAVCIYGSDPALCRVAFYFFQRILAFRLQDYMDRVVPAQPDDEIRHVIVHLPVIEIRNCESEPRILDE